MGVDISDPVDVLVTERLTMLLNCGDDIVHLGNCPCTIQQDIAQSARVYSAKCGLSQSTVPRTDKHLQHALTERLQETRKDIFLARLDDGSRERVL